MKNPATKLLTVGLTVLLLASMASAQRFNNIVDRSLYCDKQAFHEGDIVTILLYEVTQGKNSTETRTLSDNEMDADLGTGGLLDDMLSPFSARSTLRNRNDSEGATSTQGKLVGKITAIVTEVQDTGLLAIQGTRIVNVNGEKQETTITGVIRPEDVRPDNTVYSYQVAEAQISYSGSGLATDAGKPGILTRVWNWVF